MGRIIAIGAATNMRLLVLSYCTNINEVMMVKEEKESHRAETI